MHRITGRLGQLLGRIQLVPLIVGATLFGSGKVDEIGALCAEYGVPVVVVVLLRVPHAPDR